MALIVRGIDVAALTAASFATPQEGDAFTLGVLHGLDAAAGQLEADAAAAAGRTHLVSPAAAAERIRAAIAERLANGGNS
jgi:hypothetical protein